MPNLSFDIKKAKQFYQKLLEDYNDFLKDITSSRDAINCAMAAFHLSEWVYHEYNLGPPTKKGIQNFQAQLEAQCPELKIMHDITNGSKHYNLTYTPKVDNTKLHNGSFSSGFSSGFDISGLETTIEGQDFDFSKSIKTVIEFWENYFVHTLKEEL